MWYGAVGGENSGYFNLLKTHHRVIPRVYIMDNNRTILSDATSRLLSGTVDMDAEADITRSGKISLLDPYNDLGLDFSGSAVGASYYKRHVQIWHVIYSMDWSQSYAVPLFTGPISDASKDGVVVTLEFKGMELLAQDGLLNDATWPAGQTKATLIMSALRDGPGERYFRDNSGNYQYITAPYSMESGDNLWKKMKEVADGMGMNLFYDGEGICNIRPKTTGSIFMIDSTWLTEEPDYVFEADRIKNVCRVEGASAPVPTGGDKVRMSYEAWPSPQHPFSPQSLARNGTPRVIPRIISDESLGVWEDLTNVAWRNLEFDLMACSGATAVMATAPFIEEYDVVTVNHPKLYMNVMVSKWTIPLVGDGEMSLNMFSSSSSGFTSRSNFIHNAKAFGGRMTQPGIKHFQNPWGPKIGDKNKDMYGPDRSDSKGGGKKKKKKNRKKRGKKS